MDRNRYNVMKGKRNCTFCPPAIPPRLTGLILFCSTGSPISSIIILASETAKSCSVNRRTSLVNKHLHFKQTFQFKTRMWLLEIPWLSSITDVWVCTFHWDHSSYKFDQTKTWSLHSNYEVKVEYRRWLWTKYFDWLQNCYFSYLYCYLNKSVEDYLTCIVVEEVKKMKEVKEVKNLIRSSHKVQNRVPDHHYYSL